MKKLAKCSPGLDDADARRWLARLRGDAA